MIYSPLRYPGGKSKLAPFIRSIIETQNTSNITYMEPFAGGAGVALDLLFNKTVNQIVLNDSDKAIYSFWRAVKESPQAIIDRIQSTPLTIEEWQRQKERYLTQNKVYSIDLGFAAFYLNRTNHSGILTAGPIGGHKQKSTYLLDARYHRTKLIHRIEMIAEHRSQIAVYNKDIQQFIRHIIPRYPTSAFIYFDPPYYVKGQQLYKNALSSSDHTKIAASIMDAVNIPWVMTYDDVPELRKIYAKFPQATYTLNYSAANKRKESELMIFKSADLIPDSNEIHTKLSNFQLLP